MLPTILWSQTCPPLRQRPSQVTGTHGSGQERPMGCGTHGTPTTLIFSTAETLPLAAAAFVHNDLPHHVLLLNQNLLRPLLTHRWRHQLMLSTGKWPWDARQPWFCWIVTRARRTSTTVHKDGGSRRIRLLIIASVQCVHQRAAHLQEQNTFFTQKTWSNLGDGCWWSWTFDLRTGHQCKCGPKQSVKKLMKAQSQSVDQTAPDRTWQTCQEVDRGSPGSPLVSWLWLLMLWMDVIAFLCDRCCSDSQHDGVSVCYSVIGQSSAFIFN